MLALTGPQADLFPAFKNARRLLLFGVAAAVVMPVVFALQAGNASVAISVAAVGLAVVGASVAGGGLVGFVFGIPRLLQDASPAPQAPDGTGANARPTDGAAPYGGNTSLEQISDWLTKILVGVGLTQLANIPDGLNSLGEFLAPGLGNLPGAEVFSIGLVVFAVLIGFFLTYMWTRLNLPSLFVESDIRAKLQGAEQRGVQRGEENAIKANTAVVKARQALESRQEQVPLMGLWVDDRPSNNNREMEAMESQLGVTFETRKSTEEALQELDANPGKYAFVISDMSRPGDARAGYTLLDAIKARGLDLPFVIYAASSDAAFEAEAKKRGAVGETNSPIKLLELVSGIVEAKSR